MRILQLCHRIPYPMTDGGNIAMLNLTESITSQNAEIKILALNTIKHRVDLNSIPADISTKYSIEAVNIDTTVKISKAFTNLFNSESYNVSRFYSKDFE
jgi:polysaccharide biosynthesis protein PslH